MFPVAAEPPLYHEKEVGTLYGFIPLSYPEFCKTTQSIDKDVQMGSAGRLCCCTCSTGL